MLIKNCHDTGSKIFIFYNNMKTPDTNCGKIAALTFIIASMLPEIIHKILFNLWKIKETP